MLSEDVSLGGDGFARLNKYHLGPSASGRTASGPPVAQYVLYCAGRFLRLAALYAAFHFLVKSGTPVVLFIFFCLSAAAVIFFVLQQPWRGRKLQTAQWLLAVLNGAVMALSQVLWALGLVKCGPIRIVMAEYAGAVVAACSTMVVFRSHRAAKINGVLLILLAFFLVEHGWSMASHFVHREATEEVAARVPEEKADVGLLEMLIPIVAGLLGALRRLLARLGRSQAKKRLHAVTVVSAALFLLPFAVLQLTSGVEPAPSTYGGSPMLVYAVMIVLGIVVPFYIDVFAEERLRIGPGSVKHLAVTVPSIGALELAHGMDFSPLGYGLVSILMGIGLFWSSSVERAKRTSADDEDGAKDRRRASVVPSALLGPLEHVLADSKSVRIALFLLINTAFMFVEFSYGLLSNSLGLLSDACHMLFDCAALAIGLYASYIARLPSTSKYNYGYGRVEVLSGYVNAVFLVLVAALIVVESIERMLDPPDVSTKHLLVVSLGGLAVNVVGLIFFHEAHHHAHGGSCSHSSGAHSHGHSEHDHTHDVHGHGHGHGHGHEHGRKSCGHDHLSHGHRLELATGAEGQLGAETEAQDRHPVDSSRSHGSGGHHHNHGKDLSNEAGGDGCGPGNGHESAHGHGHEGSATDSEGLHIEDVGHDHSSHCGHSEISHRHSHSHGHSHGQSHGLSRGHSHNHEHQLQEDSVPHMDHNMHGIFLHVLADTLGSVGVVVSTLLIKYKGWLLSDPACSIFISVLIVASVVPLLHGSAEIILQRLPRPMEAAVRKTLEKVEHMEGVTGHQRAHFWSFTPLHVVGSLHVLAAAGANKRQIQGQILALFHSAGVTTMTVQVEDHEVPMLDLARSPYGAYTPTTRLL